MSNNTQNQQIKFETEPTSRFRGRFLSDYMPKKGNKTDGTKSRLRKPNYFPDARNRHCLNLFVCFFYREIFNTTLVLDSRNVSSR